MKKILAILLFSLCISIPVILPFFHTGYFPTHDGEWAVVRLGDMFRLLRDFQIPARYSGELNFGYGYPLFNFAYPLPYYVGTLIHLIGFGFVDSVKILFASSVYLSAFFMFLASRILWKNSWAGIISAILYIYFPYRMIDLYVRGSIGESLSFVLFPLLFYLAIKLISKPSFLLIGIIGISIALLITTHNIMTVLFLPLYAIFVLNQVFKSKKTIKAFLTSIALGFGLSAFFWIPALFEKSNILLSKIPIADINLYFVKLEQLIFPKWGYGVPTDPNGFSYQLGLAHLAIFVILVLSMFPLLIKNKNSFKDHFVKTTLVLIITSIAYVFLLFKPSELIWKLTPLLSEINYPWIILGILGFIISLLSGFLSKQTIGKYLMIIFGIIAIFTVFPYARPQRYINNPDSYYLTNNATTTSSNELMPLWVSKIPLQKAENKVEVISGKASVREVVFNSKKINFSVDASTKTVVRINTIYYPGWKISVNKIGTQISYNNDQGAMEISLPEGQHVVNGRFEETLLRLASDAISLLSFFIILLFIIKKNKYAIF